MTEKKQPFFGHTPESQKRALEGLKKFLPPMDANDMEENVLYLEKLVYLTLDMKKDIISRVDKKVIAQSFRLSTTALIRSFLAELSTSIKQDILFALQEQSPIGEFEYNIKSFVKYIRQQEAKGRIILDKDSCEEYV